MITSVFLLMALKGIFLIRFRKEMQEFGCYTMGIIKDPPVKILGNFFIFYSYTYKGKVYTDFAFLSSQQVSKGGRYLVYLDSKRPYYSRIDLSHQVTSVELHKIVSAPYPHQLH